MAELNPQFYDQLAERLNRQDVQLDRIEGSQDTLLSLIRDQKEIQAAHVASDRMQFKWIKIIGGAMWGAIVGIIAFLSKYLP